MVRSHMQCPTKSGITTTRSDYLGEDMELTSAVENTTIREIQWEALP